MLRTDAVAHGIVVVLHRFYKYNNMDMTIWAVIRDHVTVSSLLVV